MRKADKHSAKFSKVFSSEPLERVKMPDRLRVFTNVTSHTINVTYLTCSTTRRVDGWDGKTCLT